MAHEPYVFYCENGCQKYVLVNMDLKLEGEHVMVCPSCKHHHYRFIRNGEITGDRHSRGDAVDTIEPMPSAVFPTREAAQEALGVGKTKRNSFLNSLWRRKAHEDEGWMK